MCVLTPLAWSLAVQLRQIEEIRFQQPILDTNHVSKWWTTFAVRGNSFVFIASLLIPLALILFNQPECLQIEKKNVQRLKYHPKYLPWLQRASRCVRASLRGTVLTGQLLNCYHKVRIIAVARLQPPISCNPALRATASLISSSISYI